MQINLTPELDRFVEEKVASGLYESPSEVVREALRLLFEREPLSDWLHHEAKRGFRQLDVGEAVDLTSEEFLAQMHDHNPR